MSDFGMSDLLARPFIYFYWCLLA